MSTDTQQTEDVLSVTEIVGSLSDTTVGLAIHMKKWRIGKALDQGQRERMAQNFAAESTAVSGRKKLIDTSNEQYRMVNRVIEEAYSFWKFHTIPYPQHGLRLINRERVQSFNDDFAAYQNRLTIAVDELEAVLPGLIDAQQSKLGQLFSRSDYPQSVEGLYELSYDVHDINPPSYLAQLDPNLFREQMQRAQDRIQHSISLLENEFLSEMQKFVEQLVNGLSKTEAGKRKSVRESSITKLNEFFDRFSELNLNSSGQLNTLVTRAREAMNGRGLSDLRTNDGVRDDVRAQLAAIQGEVDRMIETRTGRQFDVVED